MNKFAFLGTVAISSLLIGCGSTQQRGIDKGMTAGADAKGECCTQVACNHANTAYECPHCVDGEACCENCATKMAEMCPDCNKANMTAKACPGCESGEVCDKCKA